MLTNCYVSTSRLILTDHINFVQQTLFSPSKNKEQKRQCLNVYAPGNKHNSVFVWMSSHKYNLRSTQASSMTSTIIPIITAKCNGQFLHLLVDTASDCTLVTREALTRTKTTSYNSDEISINELTDKITTSSGESAKLELEFDSGIVPINGWIVNSMCSPIPKRYKNLFFRLQHHLQDLILGLMESQAQLADTLASVKELEKGFAAQSKKIDDAKSEDAKNGSRSLYLGVS